MALLDLQGMRLSISEERAAGSHLSLTGCPGRSSLSVLECF
jgi:SapB morphogen precursor RamS